MTKRIGIRDHALYSVWDGMSQRTGNPNHRAFPDYGGRGITVCEEWRDYTVFYGWAIQTWQPGLQLDRIDNSAGYSPDNCAFRTRSENQRNRRNNLMISAFEETKCGADWADDARCSITLSALSRRLRRGWEAERAITQPSTKAPRC